MISRYLLHGLCVASELELNDRACELTREPDVVVTHQAVTAVPTEPRRGSLLASSAKGAPAFSFVDCGDQYSIRFSEHAEFLVSRDSTHVTVQSPAAADDEIPAILLTGNVLGFLLAHAGECVLHAGAVKIAGSTVAIVGGTGVGKSTVTALLCGAGGCLVSDDILRVAAGELSVTCFAGTAEIRLRGAAAELAHLLPNAKRRWTVDDRLAVAAPLCDATELTVDTIVIPAPARGAKRLEVRRLVQRDAVVALLRNPRVTGWHIAEPVRRHFIAATEVARIVPVFQALIPWGPPFDADLAAELVEAIT